MSISVAIQVALQNQYTFFDYTYFITVVNLTFVLYSGYSRSSLNCELFFYVNEDWTSENSCNKCTNNLTFYRVFGCFLVFLYVLQERLHIA
jgi:hypothetical protein